MKKINLFPILFSLFIATSLSGFTQNNNITPEQKFETDPVILNRIRQWQDLKFGFMMHWGIYSQWGVVESWSICNEPWIDRGGVPYNEYVAKYQALNKTFNPTNFSPNSWADLAKEAGMKYVVFTTKHHDGFCMYDTKQTSYSVTDKSCPFSLNEKADIAGEVAKAFRKNNFWIGFYFSKPDWHCPDYWAPEWATPDRSVNYDPKTYPERWQKYCNFTYNQIKELTHNYGDIDILWLDGGWVRPEWSLNNEYRQWLGCKQWIQDIDMTKIATMARENNPDLLIVDRTIHGKYENYQTPEQEVPDTLLPFPWETCMSMGNSWSYVPNDEYKSVNKLIHILIDVVAKGGNYLLNVGPGPDGTLPPVAVDRMKNIGKWMAMNGEAIYGTRPIYPYCYDKLRFTQKKDGHVYAIYLLNEGEKLPKFIDFKCSSDQKSSAKVMGTSTKVTLKKSGEIYRIIIPSKLRNNPPCNDAIVFELMN